MVVRVLWGLGKEGGLTCEFWAVFEVVCGNLFLRLSEGTV